MTLCNVIGVTHSDARRELNYCSVLLTFKAQLESGTVKLLHVFAKSSVLEG